MPSKPDVTIIIPAYNEEGGITSVITQLKDLSGNYEIVVVDDGSTDNSYKLATDTGVKVIRQNDPGFERVRWLKVWMA